jgi:hypothetical protein
VIGNWNLPNKKKTKPVIILLVYFDNFKVEINEQSTKSFFSGTKNKKKTMIDGRRLNEFSELAILVVASSFFSSSGESKVIYILGIENLKEKSFHVNLTEFSLVFSQIPIKSLAKSFTIVIKNQQKFEAI